MGDVDPDQTASYGPVRDGQHRLSSHQFLDTQLDSKINIRAIAIVQLSASLVILLIRFSKEENIILFNFVIPSKSIQHQHLTTTTTTTTTTIFFTALLGAVEVIMN